MKFFSSQKKRNKLVAARAGPVPESALNNLSKFRGPPQNTARGYMLNLIALSSKSLGNADKEYGIRYLEYIVGK